MSTDFMDMMSLSLLLFALDFVVHRTQYSNIEQPIINRNIDHTDVVIGVVVHHTRDRSIDQSIENGDIDLIMLFLSVVDPMDDTRVDQTVEYRIAQKRATDTIVAHDRTTNVDVWAKSDRMGTLTLAHNPFPPGTTW